MSDVVLPGILNLPFVEGVYEQFLRDPASVPDEWRDYFRTLENGDGTESIPRSRLPQDGAGKPLRSTAAARAKRDQAKAIGAQDRVDQLIRVYRMRGHIIAQVDPLGFTPPPPPELDPEFYGLSEAEMDRAFSCET